MRPKATLLSLIFLGLLPVEPAHAQRPATALQSGASIEREIEREYDPSL